MDHPRRRAAANSRDGRIYLTTPRPRTSPHLRIDELRDTYLDTAQLVMSQLHSPAGPSQTTHRRISSAGRSRRRRSDARDAATRPSPTSLQTASASLAALSLASPDDDPSSKSGRKRGTVFTCESCSKVYRHPSCLIKHRWEHTPHWREASKFVLSKHQQVQLLEAAAILSHLSPSSASLPEDRSLWPSFLSGGLVPPPSGSVPTLAPGKGDVRHTRTGTAARHPPPISRSVPVMGIDTQGRPRLLGVDDTAEDDARNLLALSASRRARHAHSHSLSQLPSRPRPRAHRHAHSYSHSHVGWSLPRSSVRSKSGSSCSASECRSDDEQDEDEDEDEVQVGSEDETEDTGIEQWDGMEMEMEMD